MGPNAKAVVFACIAAGLTPADAMRLGREVATRWGHVKDTDDVTLEVATWLAEELAKAK